MTQATGVKTRTVATRADLEKEVEKEIAFLMREGMPRDAANREARKYIEEQKYAEVAQKLAAQGK